MASGMRIFSEAELRSFLDVRKSKLHEEVESEGKNQLLNYNEVEYTDYLISKYSLDLLVFHWDSVAVTDREDEVPVRTPRGYSHRKQQIITYHIPFSGAPELLQFRPSRYISWSTDVDVRGSTVCFDVVNWRDNPSEVKSDADYILSTIKEQAGNVNEQVQAYNTYLQTLASQVVKNRKAKLLKQSDLLASLGVPIKKAGHVPATFAVPVPKKRVVFSKPETSTAPYTPEPALDSSTYEHILRICRDTGIEIERHPNLYINKNEESLRDYFLMVLSPHFESVTGETFNRMGKTDILIRHEHSNVFVAECKFWRGSKHFYKTVDQTLSYLTWRDSKAAILCFVRNKELGPVLEQIETKTERHPCFVKATGKIEDGWFRFAFHLPEDATRGVDLNVLCFHFPQGDA
jgi:hypothetical protein